MNANTQNQISVIIIEDEKDAEDYLLDILRKDFPSIKVDGIEDNVQGAIHLITKTSPEIVFMDIEINGGDAFDILDSLKEINFEIIFISAHSQYLEKSLEYHSLNYIKKPFQPEKLQSIIKRYTNLKERLFSKQKYDLFKEFMFNSKLFLNIGNEYIVIDLNDVIKCVVDGNYCCFHMVNKNVYITSESLKHYTELLKEKGFFRANRSVLVNINYIHSIYRKETLILKNKEKINVSVRTRGNLTALINHFS